MQRIDITPRPNWRRTAEEHGFAFHSPRGETYWDESAYWRFTLADIENGLEAPAAELEQMCFDVVERAMRDQRVMERLHIPQASWDYIAATWRNREKNLYGRMDLCFSGHGPAKLYEYNADTPTALYEAAVFQWVWLEEQKAAGRLPDEADQFNSIHEQLINAFRRMGLKSPLHLASQRGHQEDRGTVEYLADCARQAGLTTELMAIEDIGIADTGVFTDLQDRPIANLFKLYPWEWLLREDFARHIPRARCAFIEPAWKSVLSNKGLLALLWEMFPGHPNLLPSYFEGDAKAADLGSSYVRKPLYSREGANIELVGAGGGGGLKTAGPYGREGHILQAYHPLPEHRGNRAVCGVWLVASEPVGLGLREEKSLVTTDAARFVPHAIVG